MWFSSDMFGDSGYEDARLFLDGITEMHEVWGLFTPPKPLRRSGLGVLGSIKYAFPEGEPVTVSALAKIMRQTNAAISQKVADLERDGYLERERSKSDKRSATLHLTPKGHELMNQSIQEIFARVQIVLDELGEEDTKQLLALFSRLQTAIKKVQEDEESEC